jgi:hypothetical protein
MNVELEKTYEWFKSNRLSLSINKTNVMFFCGKKKNYNEYDVQIKIIGILLEVVSKTKFLGIIIA